VFTGIVKEVGEIASGPGELPVLRIAAKELPGELARGDSVAVNGACLTVRTVERGGFSVELSGRSLRMTSFGMLRRGSKVNLEAALKLGGRLGGHFVSGHVDGVGRVRSAGRRSGDHEFSVMLPPGLEQFVFEGCSIAVDGVSLTVGMVKGREIGFWVVPYTYENTIINTYRAGTRVNVEVDLLGRFVEKLLASGRRASSDPMGPGGGSEWERWEE